MMVGIRGTSGLINADNKEVTITDGEVEVILTNSETGESQSIKVAAGKTLVLTDTDENGNVTATGYTLQDADLTKLPEYVLEEIKETPELAERVAEAYGISKDELLDKVDDALEEKKNPEENTTQTSNSSTNTTTAGDDTQQQQPVRRRAVAVADNDETENNQTSPVTLTVTTTPATTIPTTPADETPTDETKTPSTNETVGGDVSGGDGSTTEAGSDGSDTGGSNADDPTGDDSNGDDSSGGVAEEQEEPEEPTTYAVSVSAGGANYGDVSVMSADGKSVGSFDASTGVFSADVPEGTVLTIQFAPAYYCTFNPDNLPDGMSEPSIQESPTGDIYTCTYTVGAEGVNLDLPIEMMPVLEDQWLPLNQQVQYASDKFGNTVLLTYAYGNYAMNVLLGSDSYVNGLSSIMVQDGMIEVICAMLEDESTPVYVEENGVRTYFKYTGDYYYIDYGVGYVCGQDSLDVPYTATNDHLYVIYDPGRVENDTDWRWQLTKALPQ